MTVHPARHPPLSAGVTAKMRTPLAGDTASGAQAGMVKVDVPLVLDVSSSHGPRSFEVSPTPSERDLMRSAAACHQDCLGR